MASSCRNHLSPCILRIMMLTYEAYLKVIYARRESMGEFSGRVDVLKPVPPGPMPTFDPFWQDGFVVGKPGAQSAHEENGRSEPFVPEVESNVDPMVERRPM